MTAAAACTSVGRPCRRTLIILVLRRVIFDKRWHHAPLRRPEIILTQDVATALGLRLAGEIDGRDQPGERLKVFVLLQRRFDPAVEYGGVAEAGGGEPVDAVHPARIAPVLRAVGFG